MRLTSLQVGNCITIPRLKIFLCLLSLTPIAFAIGVFPITRVLWHHVLFAFSVSRNDPWANQLWWNWRGSWIVGGGPIGRWMWGIVLGFRILKATRDATVSSVHLIEQPHLRVVGTAIFGLALSLFSAVSSTCYIQLFNG